MTGAVGGVPNIQSVGDFARQLYTRAHTAGAEFDDLTTSLRSLQRALRHLHAEAQDPDSPIHQSISAGPGNQSAIYARQLTSLVQDSKSTLQQVNDILDTYEHQGTRRSARDGFVGEESDATERARKIRLMQGCVASQRMKIDLFLNALQLPNPTKTQFVLERADDQQLDMIGNKVDAIANRLFRERNRRSAVDGTDEDLWRDFKAELEREGFSSDVLRENKVRDLSYTSCG
jgi:hypothetical protein